MGDSAGRRAVARKSSSWAIGESTVPKMLPWSLAVLVLFLEAAQKGIATALVIAASSIALLFFLLAGLLVYAREGADRESRPTRTRNETASPLCLIETRALGSRRALEESRVAMLLERTPESRNLENEPIIAPNATSAGDRPKITTS